MAELSLPMLQKLCSMKQIIWSVHAAERMQLRGISRKDVIRVISNGKIIENYPDDRPYPSCLILGSGESNQQIHVVCGTDGNVVKIITAYYPSNEKFDSSREKRKEKHR